MGSFVCSCEIDFFFLNQDCDVEEQSECLGWFYVTAELLLTAVWEVRSAFSGLSPSFRNHVRVGFLRSSHNDVVPNHTGGTKIEDFRMQIDPDLSQTSLRSSASSYNPCWSFSVVSALAE